MLELLAGHITATVQTRHCTAPEQFILFLTIRVSAYSQFSLAVSEWLWFWGKMVCFTFISNIVINYISGDVRSRKNYYRVSGK